MINDFSYPQRLRSSTFRSSLALLLTAAAAFAAAKVEERERKLFYNFFKVRKLCSLSLLLFSQLELYKSPEFYKSLELLEISSKQARARSLPVGKKKMIAGCVSSLSGILLEELSLHSISDE